VFFDFIKGDKKVGAFDMPLLGYVDVDQEYVLFLHELV
jgi:hypothetical protein